jgi:hypothetical protein
MLREDWRPPFGSTSEPWQLHLICCTFWRDLRRSDNLEVVRAT